MELVWKTLCCFYFQQLLLLKQSDTAYSCKNIDFQFGKFLDRQISKIKLTNFRKINKCIWKWIIKAECLNFHIVTTLNYEKLTNFVQSICETQKRYKVEAKTEGEHYKFCIMKYFHLTCFVIKHQLFWVNFWDLALLLYAVKCFLHMLSWYILLLVGNCQFYPIKVLCSLSRILFLCRFSMMQYFMDNLHIEVLSFMGADAKTNLEVVFA